MGVSQNGLQLRSGSARATMPSIPPTLSRPHPAPYDPLRRPISWRDNGAQQRPPRAASAIDSGVISTRVRPRELPDLITTGPPYRPKTRLPSSPRTSQRSQRYRRKAARLKESRWTICRTRQYPLQATRYPLVPWRWMFYGKTSPSRQPSMNSCLCFMCRAVTTPFTPPSLATSNSTATPSPTPSANSSA